MLHRIERDLRIEEFGFPKSVEKTSNSIQHRVSDNLWFTVDELLEALGSTLKLPKQYEAHRAEIEAVLPALA